MTGEDISIIVFFGVVVGIVLAGYLYNKWEDKKATTCYEKRNKKAKDKQ